jgi:predicted DNA-binding antitoxin AbrB/MazE fold protein
MVREFRAKFSRGKIEPLEEVDLKEGDEVRVIIPDHAKGKRLIEALRATAGGWKDLVDGEELKRNIYADRLISTRPEPKL